MARLDREDEVVVSRIVEAVERICSEVVRIMHKPGKRITVVIDTKEASRLITLCSMSIAKTTPGVSLIQIEDALKEALRSATCKKVNSCLARELADNRYRPF